MKNKIRAFVNTFARTVGLEHTEQKIAGDSQRYWSNAGESDFRSNSHWRGKDGLSDETWLELGKIHMRLFDEFIELTSLVKPLERIVEWGCGGGSNAVQFCKAAHQFVGVDVSQPTLDECGKNLRDTGYDNFLPVLVDVARPEAAIELITGPCDLFLCTYVFELIPSPEYGRRLLVIAHRLLRPGGVALIQIKYETKESRTKARRWGYRANLANMTTYPIDRFWELAAEVGFKPKALTLQPKQPLVNDERYAYFLLERPRAQSAG